MRAISRHSPTQAGSRSWLQAVSRSASLCQSSRASNCLREKGKGGRNARRFALPPQLQGARRAAGRGAGTRTGAGRHGDAQHRDTRKRSEEHKSELQSLMRISYAVFCLKKKKKKTNLLKTQ